MATLNGIFMYITLFICAMEVDCRRSKNQLIRKKRYVAFPEGSSFSAVICLTSQMGITDGAQIFTEGINWGLVYDLPNDTKPVYDYFENAQKRRNRRELYTKIEDIVSSMGYSGRSCVLRSLCEAGRTFKERESSLLHHILGLIFRFPQESLLVHEPEEHKIYHWASKLGEDETRGNQVGNRCADVFQCPFSLIEMALGYYSSISSMNKL